MTMRDGIFSCGNALHVNDLVDYVSEGAEIAGENAALYSQKKRALIDIEIDKVFIHSAPKIDINAPIDKIKVYFVQKTT